MRPVSQIRRLGATLTYARELDTLPLGSVVLVSSSPDPCYFRRSSLGWLACHRDGDTSLHAELVEDLDGWPTALPTRELRLPAVVIYLPADMVLPPRDRARYKVVA